MGNATTFNDRIARIEARANKGQNTGFVTPGVVDETSGKSAQSKTRRPRTRRSGYLVSVLGGLFASFAVVGIGLVFLMSSADGNSFEEIAASILLSDE